MRLYSTSVSCASESSRDLYSICGARPWAACRPCRRTAPWAVDPTLAGSLEKVCEAAQAGCIRKSQPFVISAAFCAIALGKVRVALRGGGVRTFSSDARLRSHFRVTWMTTPKLAHVSIADMHAAGTTRTPSKPWRRLPELGLRLRRDSVPASARSCKGDRRAALPVLRANRIEALKLCP